VRLAVWAVPGASRSVIDGVRDGRLRVRVAAPAHEQRANRELCRFLAGVLDLPPSRVRVVAGETSRRKTVAVDDGDAADARRRLGL
jgi:hypothetical protein